jgi:hypothetical protein
MSSTLDNRSFAEVASQDEGILDWVTTEAHMARLRFRWIQESRRHSKSVAAREYAAAKIGIHECVQLEITEPLDGLGATA